MIVDKPDITLEFWYTVVCGKPRMTIRHVCIYDEDNDLEAIAYAYGDDGQYLRPGMWSVRYIHEGGHGLMAVEYMPDGWRRQIETAGRIVLAIQRNFENRSDK